MCHTVGWGYDELIIDGAMMSEENSTCVCVSQRETGREREKKSEREKKRERERKRERENERERERERKREREGEKKKETGRERERGTVCHTVGWAHDQQAQFNVCGR